MLYITIFKNYRTKNTFIIVLLKKGQRKIIRKLGKFYYNKQLNKYILSIDLFLINKLINNGVIFTNLFSKVIYKQSSISIF